MPRHALLLPQLTISSKRKVCTSYHGLQSPQRPDRYLDPWPPHRTLGCLLTVTSVLCLLSASPSKPSPSDPLTAVLSSQKPSLNTPLYLLLFVPFLLPPPPFWQCLDKSFSPGYMLRPGNTLLTPRLSGYPDLLTLDGSTNVFADSEEEDRWASQVFLQGSTCCL